MFTKIKGNLKNNITEEIKNELIAAGKIKTFQPGSFVFKENDTSDLIYIIVEGKCEVLIRDDTDSMKIIETLGEGDIFGEMGLFLGDRRSASVKAKTLVEAVYFKESEFLKAISKIPEFNLTVMTTLVERLNKANKKIIEMQNYKEINAVCIFLVELIKDNSDEDSIKFDALEASFKLNIPIGQLIKVLYKLEKQGIILKLITKDSFHPEIQVNYGLLETFLLKHAYKKI